MKCMYCSEEIDHHIDTLLGKVFSCASCGANYLVQTPSDIQRERNNDSIKANE